MPIKTPQSIPHTSDPEIEKLKEEVSKQYFDELEKQNISIPEQIQKECPVFTQLYNLFEKELPATGHFAGLIATTLATICTDADRQANLSIGAEISEGKTTVLTQFSGLDFVNFLNTTTYSDYLLRFGGKFLLRLGQEVPMDVTRIQKDPRVPQLGEARFDNSRCKDMINNRFDIITGGEGVFTSAGFPRMQQFWNTILEEGYYEGGDSFNGTYKIGSPSTPIKHGLIIASALPDFEENFIQAQRTGWASRMVVSVYNCTTEENESIVRAITHQKIGSTRINFSSKVNFLLTHLRPNIPTKIEIGEEESERLSYLVPLLMKIRGESTGKRAASDAVRLIKGFAHLNQATKVKEEHLFALWALLCQCNRIPITTDYSSNRGELKRKVTGYQNFGSRLDFQIMLRYSLYHDAPLVKRQITEIFRNDKKKQLYPDNEIESHMRALITI